MSEYDSYLGRDSDPGGRTSPFGVPPPSVRLMGDVAECQWVEERVRPWGKSNTGGLQLGNIMPEGLAGYARVLHPAESRDDESPLRWAEVAARTGKTAHPLMQFGRLGGFDDPYGCPDWAYAPRVGRLPEHETLVLSGILRDFTTSPERCYFGFWRGYAFLGSGYERVPRICLPHRGYVVFTGQLDAVLDLTDEGGYWQTPNLWWPDDRSWFVATDIDLLDTYVGGSPACIQRILQSPELETFPTSIDARVDFRADTINIAEGDGEVTG